MNSKFCKGSSRIWKGAFSPLQQRQYGVPVYPDHLKTLENAGAVCQISEGIWELEDGSLYDNNTGLAMEAETGAAWFA